MSNSLEEQYRTSALFGSNATAVDAMYEQYMENPESVPAFGAWNPMQFLGQKHIQTDRPQSYN